MNLKAIFGKNNEGKSTKTEDGVEEALNVETKKNNFKKKFKGNCQTCDKQGHKLVDCWKGKGRPDGDKGLTFSKGDHSTRKCYRCNKMGHIAANCPDKNSETGLVAAFCTEVVSETVLSSLVSS
jgi:hypothetical protein